MVILFLGLLVVFFQKVSDGLFKEFVGGTLFVNGKDLESFKQLTIQRCCKSFSFSHGVLIYFGKIIRTLALDYPYGSLSACEMESLQRGNKGGQNQALYLGQHKEKPPRHENRQMVGKPRRLRKEVTTKHQRPVMPFA